MDSEISIKGNCSARRIPRPSFVSAHGTYGSFIALGITFDPFAGPPVRAIRVVFRCCTALDRALYFHLAEIKTVQMFWCRSAIGPLRQDVRVPPMFSY